MDWVKWCYEETRKKVPQLPDFATFWKDGMAKVWGYRKDPIALEAFRKDPMKHPLKTPSGKIEIYSEQLRGLGASGRGCHFPDSDLLPDLGYAG